MRQFDVCCKQFYVKLIEHSPPNNLPSTNESAAANHEPNATPQSHPKRTKRKQNKPRGKRRQTHSSTPPFRNGQSNQHKNPKQANRQWNSTRLIGYPVLEESVVASRENPAENASPSASPITDADDAPPPPPPRNPLANAPEHRGKRNSSPENTPPPPTKLTANSKTEEQTAHETETPPQNKNKESH